MVVPGRGLRVAARRLGASAPKRALRGRQHPLPPRRTAAIGFGELVRYPAASIAVRGTSTARVDATERTHFGVQCGALMRDTPAALRSTPSRSSPPRDSP